MQSYAHKPSIQKLQRRANLNQTPSFGTKNNDSTTKNKITPEKVLTSLALFAAMCGVAHEFGAYNERVKQRGQENNPPALVDAALDTENVD